MADIFISYARSDRDKAKALASVLVHAGLSVWWDQRIDAGADFSENIERELSAAKTVVVIWTDASAKSHWVKDEASIAQKNSTLIPLQFDASDPPIGFRQFQTIDFKQWDGRFDHPSLQTLISVVESKRRHGEQSSEERVSKRFKSQRIKYCRSADDTRIAYAIMGTGVPVVKAGNIMTHIELDAHSFAWRHLFDSLSEKNTLVRYDLRGMGLSDWDVDNVSFEDYLADLEAVVDAAGLDRFALLGFSQGCPLSIAYAAKHPERVSCLTLTAGYARGWRIRLTSQEQKREQAFLDLIETSWDGDTFIAQQMFTTSFAPEASREEARLFNKFLQRTANAKNLLRNLNAMSEIDLTSDLKSIQAPTRLFHVVDDTLNSSIDEARLIASEMQNAELIPIEGACHLVLEDDRAWPKYKDELRQFLDAHNN